RRRPPQNWMAYDYVLQARHLSDRFDVAASEALLRKAVELDPSLAEAYSRLAHPVAYKFIDDGEPAHLDEALAMAQRAVEIDDRQWDSHATLAWVYMQRRQYELAGIHYDRALALNPNDVDTRILRTFWLIYYGRLDDALGVLDAVIVADPYPPSWYWE